MLFALFKAPSAVATVGYLAVGLTFPFVAAYQEKYVLPSLRRQVLTVENTRKGESSMQGSVLMEVIVDYNRNQQVNESIAVTRWSYKRGEGVSNCMYGVNWSVALIIRDKTSLKYIIFNRRSTLIPEMPIFNKLYNPPIAPPIDYKEYKSKYMKLYNVVQ